MVFGKVGRRGVAVLASMSAIIAAACTPDNEQVVLDPCTAASCDDANDCTKDVCTPSRVCVHSPAIGACSDGSACTSGDHCSELKCVGVVVDCDDKIACTADSCLAASGCAHLAGEATQCSDGNPCTDDSCALSAGCVHPNNNAPCTDGNACTLGDTCANSQCAPGTSALNCDDGNACTADSCTAPIGQCVHVPTPGPCSDGNACTDDDACTGTVCAGTLNCACALSSGLTVATKEDCGTPFDDNCDGKINETAVCGATLYKFSSKAECDFACYLDEPHNLAVTGKASDASGFETYATGQLLDGKRGTDDWYADLGNGPSYEWVGWKAQNPTITLKFAKVRSFAFVRIGINNFENGLVLQPAEIRLRLSKDGTKWSADQSYLLADGTQPAIPKGKRGDIVLKVAPQLASYVQVVIMTPGTWTFLDELEFD